MKHQRLSSLFSGKKSSCCVI